MKKSFLLFAVILVISIVLCGCSQHPSDSATQTSPAEELLILPDGTTLDINTSDLELNSLDSLDETIETLSKLSALNSLEISAPLSAEDFALLSKSLTSTIIDAEISVEGISFKSNVQELDLKGFTPDKIQKILPALPYLKELVFVDLGDAVSSPELSLNDLAILHDVCPQAEFSFGFQLYGKEVSTFDTKLDLSYVKVEDEGAAVFEAMKYMPHLEYVDMDSCGVANENMAKIRDAYPNVKVVWRIWFGTLYSVRTDVECILASKPDVAGCLDNGRADNLMYCTDVKYLDLGHNPQLDTIEFVRYMPKLEVAILAMDSWYDCSALANCTELEYLEIQTTLVSDISALSNLKKLKHLNICWLFELDDITPLYGLTQLERLWIGCLTPIPDEQIEKMQSLAPDCVINTDTLDPTHDGWRFDEYGELVPRYKLLREQFGNYSNYAFAFYWNDPLCKEDF